MRNRDYKESGKDAYYHIYNRGNAKQDIFHDAEDFHFFLLRLRQNLFPQEARGSRITPLPEGAFSLMCYCLMPNHFHLLIRQNADIAPSTLLLKVCTSYSKYFNKRHQRVGHIFQDQFKQITVDNDNYLLWLSAYIHLNPVTAHLVDTPENYQWSSYREFLGDQKLSLCVPSVIFDQMQHGEGYRSFINKALPKLKEHKELEHLYFD